MRVSRLLDMSDRELILQLEKASTTLTRLKTANAALRRRVRELEARKAEGFVPLNNAPPPASKSETQELREKLATAEKAAIDNLTYAQEVKSQLEDLRGSMTPPPADGGTASP